MNRTSNATLKGAGAWSGVLLVGLLALLVAALLVAFWLSFDSFLHRSVDPMRPAPIPSPDPSKPPTRRIEAPVAPPGGPVAPPRRGSVSRTSYVARAG